MTAVTEGVCRRRELDVRRWQSPSSFAHHYFNGEQNSQYLCVKSVKRAQMRPFRGSDSQRRQQKSQGAPRWVPRRESNPGFTGRTASAPPYISAPVKPVILPRPWQNRRRFPLADAKCKKDTRKGCPLHFGGGGGNRTRVRKSLDTAFSECSPSFGIPLTHRRWTGYALR